MTLWSRLRHRLGPGHLADDELLELLIPAGPNTLRDAARAHLDRCETCVSRSGKLRTFLNGITETNEATLATTFPLDRLATQRERIMRRLRRSVEPAGPTRVLRFPSLSRPALAGVHRARHWLGAAAAVGLLVGMTVGQFVHVHTEPSVSARDTSASNPMASTTGSALWPSTAEVSDPAMEHEDALLDELELMLSRPHVPGLSPLDEITPRIREVAVNVW